MIVRVSDGTGLPIRPRPTADDEFEEVALRLAEVGTFDEEGSDWSTTFGDLEKGYRVVESAIKKIEDVLGREALVEVGPTLLHDSADWWRRVRLGEGWRRA